MLCEIVIVGLVKLTYELSVCKIIKILRKITIYFDRSQRNSYYIRCGGTNKPYQILKQLYDSCEIHLDRKYNIYKDLETVVLSRNT